MMKEYVMNITQKQRQYLRKTAHELKPVVQIGKQGVGESTFASVDQVLNTQELIKMKFNDFQDEKQALAEEVASETRSVLVGIIGNTAILYRPSPYAEHRKIVLPL